MNKYIERLKELDVEAMKADGFDDCIIGIVEGAGMAIKLLYSTDKIIKQLLRDGMTDEEALEYYGYNIVNAYVGESSPAFKMDYNED